MTKPVRIMIIGNSVPILVVPNRPARAEGSYGERLEQLLRDKGVPAEVDNQARLFELLHEGGPRFRHELVSRFPDVLVVHYGILELQPNVLPTRVVRHLTREVNGGRGVRGVWMRHGVKLVWPRARSYQRWASARAGQRTWRLQPKRFTVELRQVVRVARTAKTLVLVVDVHRPNARLEHFLPGLGERWERYQANLRDALSAFADDPDVRLVESSAVVDDLPEGEGTVDGLHLTPVAHGLVAEQLAHEVVSWLARVP